jgi:hypothetical protein
MLSNTQKQMLQKAAQNLEELYAVMCVALLVNDLNTLAYIAKHFASKLEQEDVAYINTLVAQQAQPAHAVH